ncbi:hypothetical protein MKX03_036093 [Papaver bracteatum]|nr:hypothetical protein MKX03_036093 [Papaver bracteatum]
MLMTCSLWLLHLHWDRTDLLLGLSYKFVLEILPLRGGAAIEVWDGFLYQDQLCNKFRKLVC